MIKTPTKSPPPRKCRDHMIPVPMGLHLCRHAAYEGVDRQLGGSGRGRWGAKQIEHGFNFNCHGTIGEKAVALWLRCDYNSYYGQFGKKDVGDVLQVRSTPHPDGSLLIHPTDCDDDIFILVLTDKVPGCCWLAGWLTGKRAKAVGKWKGTEPGRECFWISQADLNTMLCCPYQPKPLLPVNP